MCALYGYRHFYPAGTAMEIKKKNCDTRHQLFSHGDFLFFIIFYLHATPILEFDWIRIRPSSSRHLVEHHCVHMVHSCTKHWFIAGPSSRTSAQHYSSIVSMSRASTLISLRDSCRHQLTNPLPSITWLMFYRSSHQSSLVVLSLGSWALYHTLGMRPRGTIRGP